MNEYSSHDSHDSHNSHDSQDNQVRLAHLWVDFRVIMPAGKTPDGNKSSQTGASAARSNIDMNFFLQFFRIKRLRGYQGCQGYGGYNGQQGALSSWNPRLRGYGVTSLSIFFLFSYNIVTSLPRLLGLQGLRWPSRGLLLIKCKVTLLRGYKPEDFFFIFFRIKRLRGYQGYQGYGGNNGHQTQGYEVTGLQALLIFFLQNFRMERLLKLPRLHRYFFYNIFFSLKLQGYEGYKVMRLQNPPDILQMFFFKWIFFS